MDNEHTKGRVRIGRPRNAPPCSLEEIAAGPHDIYAIDVPDYEWRAIGNGSTHADTRRLVACWNALKDFANPERVMADLLSDRDELKIVRRALFACLENMKIRRAAGVESGPTIERLIEQAEIAILAKHAPKVPT